MKRKIIVLASVVIFLAIIIALTVIDTEDIHIDLRPIDSKFSFSDIKTIEDLKKYDGKRIEIYGFMSPLSPYGYSFVYIADTPYANNLFDESKFTSIAVFTEDDKGVFYTNDIVKVVGTIKFENYKDANENQYSYRMVDSIITEVEMKDLDENIIPYYIISKELILDAINECFMYIDLAINYETYEKAGYITTTDLVNINIESLNGILEKLESHKNDMDITILKDVVTSIKLISESINTDLNNKAYNKLKNYSDTFDESYNKFEQWVFSFKI